MAEDNGKCLPFALALYGEQAKDCEKNGREQSWLVPFLFARRAAEDRVLDRTE